MLALLMDDCHQEHFNSAVPPPEVNRVPRHADLPSAATYKMITYI